MTSVVLVHGTGVREADYVALFGKVSAQLEKLCCDLTLVHCFWGAEHGARLPIDSLPGQPAVPSAADAAVRDDEDAVLASWALLDADPLTELRILAADERYSPGSHVPSQDETPPEQLCRRLRALPRDPVLTQVLAIHGITPEVIGDVADEVARTLTTLLPDTQLDSSVLRRAVARAVVASALVSAEERQGSTGISTDGETIDDLVKGTLAALGEPGAALGVVSDGARLLGFPLWRSAEWLTSWRVARNRPKISDSTAPPIGDILRYQARGEGLRSCIAAAVASAEPPVVVLAHSLGGVACVDLFNQENHYDTVAALVTVGSQAAYLYEMDALSSLPFGKPLPEYFPRRWLNAYDPRDPLAYLAAPVFGHDKVTDQSFNTRRPLLRAHSAYWDHKPFYTWLNEELFQ
ncbi:MULTISPECIES: hypothetical protein [Streptomyces]|uniref:AB hydrolase-1 domain-containing protein n=1 Tax=Streptomyces mordarskii TaxID=1226758 RepID=A0ABP3NID9_9ACTN|nr:hypothetical protein OG751_47100 [Streptomyces antimycoticus]